MGDYSATILSLQPSPQQGEGDAAAGTTINSSPSNEAPPPSPDGPYADTIRALGAARQQAAHAALASAADAKPDEAARAAAVAPQVGVPAPAVEQDLPAFEQQLQTQHNAAIVNNNPVLAGWLAANPESARIAKDDFDNLDTISKTWKALSSGWGESFLQNERGRLGTMEETGSTDPAVAARAGAIDQSIAAQPQLSGLYGVLQKASGFAGGILDNFIHATPQAAQGMALGAGIGAASTPEAFGAGGAPGAVAGLGLGFATGVKWDMARIAAGNSYLDLGKIKGANGEAIDEGARQAASVLVGLGTYALADIGGKAAEGFMSDAVKEAVTQPTVARAMALFGKQLAAAGVEGAAVNAGLEGASIFGEEFAKQVSSGQFDTVFNDPMMRQQALDRLMSAAVDGAMLFPLMRLPFAGSSLVADTLRARQATADAGVFQNLEAGAAQSKVRSRSLGAFQDFLSRQADGSPVENLFIPGARVAELYQSLNQAPRDGDALFGKFMPDIAQQIEQARATGGDVVVPTADYVAHFAGTPVSEALRPDIRVRQDGMSLREAADFEKSRNQLLADNAVSMRTEAEHQLQAEGPVQQVHDDIFSKLRAAGQTVDAARQNAALIAARYSARADRLEGAGGNAFDLYESTGLDVRRILPGSLDHVPVDQTDLLINAIRNGKQPTDRQLFGPSLGEYLARRGGVVDEGGELAAMDADKFHRGKVGMPKLIRPPEEERGAALPGMAADKEGHEYGADSSTRAAWEMGYFPEHGEERPAPNDLFAALRDELAGKPRYAEATGTDRREEFRTASEDLAQYLDEKGIDVSTATNTEIKKAIDDARGGEEGGRDFEQAASPDDKRRFGVDLGRHLRGEGRVGDLLRISGVSPVFQAVGLPVRDIRLPQGVARKVMGGKHSIPENVIRRLPDLLAEPVMVFDSATVRGAFVAVLDAKDADGNPLIAALQPDRSGAHVFNIVTSIYGKEDPAWFQRQIDDGRLRYIDEKKTATWSAAHRALIARGGPSGGGKKVITEADIVKGKPGGFEQAADGGAARGKITMRDGATLISLFRDADLSTFLHESGHLFLLEMIADAGREDAPQGLKDDMASILKWLGADSADAITVEQHEQWARGFETYLMEGRAPSAALSSAFRKFKAWLVSIYQSVLSLRSPVNDQIRGVMDRMLASDQEIASARNAERLNPIFPDAKSAGMTDAEYRAYTDGAKKAAASADERLLRKAMAFIRERRTAEWKAEEATMREEVGGEIRARPDLRAQYFLRTGKLLDAPDTPRAEGAVKLSREELVASYGTDEVLKLLPKGVYSKEGGVDPAEVAEMFGYRSGDEMVKALMSLEATRKSASEQVGKTLDGNRYINHLIDRETEARMVERHGDALSDGSIEEEALAAVHSDAQADLMATELRMLARRAGGEAPFSVEQLRHWVAGEISDMPMDRAARVSGFTRAEAKAGKEVERALLAGDFKAAFEAKQRQIINHLFAIESRLAAEDRDAGQKLFDRFASRNTFATIDQAYTDRIHELLKRFDYPTRRSDAELAGGLKGETLESFVSSKIADGHEIVFPSFLLDPRFSKSIDAMTVDEYRGLKDAVESLAHNGRDEKTITVEGKKIELANLVQEAVDQMDGMPKIAVPKDINPGTGEGVRGRLERLRELMRTANAGMMKEENVFDWLDRRDPNGVFNRVVFRRLKDAQHRENDLMSQVTERLKKLGDSLGKDWRKSLNERKSYPELPDRQGAVTWRKQDILAMALNTGNEGNFDKLVKGYGWSRETVNGVLRREMSKADWDFVQGVWDTFENLYPEIEAMTRRLTGVGPEKVEAIPVETPHGRYRGGYYPVVYDPMKSQRAAMLGSRSAAQMFESDYYRATTPKGHTIARIDNYAAPLRLSVDIIPWKLGQAIHDLAFREAVMDADKFLGDKRLREAVDESLGKAYTANFRKWLQSIANERNIDDKGLAGMDWFLRQARVNATMVGIGFRISTMLKHGFSALSNSFGEIGSKWMLRGMAEVYGSPAQFRNKWDYALIRSGELRHRVDQIDRDVREGLRTLAGETSIRATAERYGHYGVAMLDMGSAVPTWYGAYRKAMSEGMGDDDAVYAADKAVRNAHGAGGALDMSAVQRGGEMAKLLTMFYGFFNHIYNRQADTLRMAGEATGKLKGGDYAGARRDFAMVLARSFYYLIVPAAVEGLVAEGGPNEDKDETWAGWSTRQLLGEVPAGIPVLRDIAKAALTGRDYEMSPVTRMFDTVIKSTTGDIPALLGLRDKEASSRWLQHAIETSGYVFGLPSGQAAGTSQYLWDVWNEAEAPQGITDFMRGLMYGPAPKKS